MTEDHGQATPATDLGWMLSCSGVHPEAVKIVEGLQGVLRELREIANDFARTDNEAIRDIILRIDDAERGR